jgi:hypothetical protein
MYTRMESGLFCSCCVVGCPFGLQAEKRIVLMSKMQRPPVARVNIEKIAMMLKYSGMDKESTPHFQSYT